MAKEKSNMWIIGIVAIVAIVALTSVNNNQVSRSEINDISPSSFLSVEDEMSLAQNLVGDATKQICDNKKRVYGNRAWFKTWEWFKEECAHYYVEEGRSPDGPTTETETVSEETCKNKKRVYGNRAWFKTWEWWETNCAHYYEQKDQANPAATKCTNDGGEIQSLRGSGEMCKLADGTTCELWAYFRGECPTRESVIEVNPNGTSITDVGGEVPITTTYYNESDNPGVVVPYNITPPTTGSGVTTQHILEVLNKCEVVYIETETPLVAGGNCNNICGQKKKTCIGGFRQTKQVNKLIYDRASPSVTGPISCSDSIITGDTDYAICSCCADFATW